MNDDDIVAKGRKRLGDLGLSGALEVMVELGVGLQRHGYPCEPHHCSHLAGRATEDEWAALVARWRARKALEPS